MGANHGPGAAGPATGAGIGGEEAVMHGSASEQVARDAPQGPADESGHARRREKDAHHQRGEPVDDALHRVAGHSGSLRLVGGRNLKTQDAPLDVGPQLLARHPAVREPFDLWAMLGGDRAAVLLPLRNSAAGNTQGAGECRLTAEKTGCDVDGVFVHAPHSPLDRLALQEALALASERTHGRLRGMSIHTAIKARRIALEWSQEKLAEEVSLREESTKVLAWQTVQQWENGTSAPNRKRLPYVAQALGLTLDQLTALAGGQDSPTTPAHPESLPDVKLSSPLLGWGVIQMKELPKAFKVAAPDDSMAPRLKAGQVAEFEVGLELRPGDGVLVRDADGEPCIRRCRRARGEWEAYAEDGDNHLPFAFGAEQLLAVLVGVHARWG